VTEEISDRQRTALYMKQYRTLADNKDYRALSDAEKQEMYGGTAIQVSPSWVIKCYEGVAKEASQLSAGDAEQNLVNRVSQQSPIYR